MSDDIRVRVDRPQFRYDKEQYTEGDELDVEPRVLERHPNSLTRIDETGPDTEESDSADEPVDDSSGGDEQAGGGGQDGDEKPDADPHPSELTVSELRNRVDDVNDPALLEAILEAEEDGDDRTTAVEAIQARLNAVQEE